MRLDVCSLVAMPNIDVGAKQWESDLAERVGLAVATRRKALRWTAVQLSERTRQIGYPISRVAITKIEKNARAGKLDVAELIVLATALDIPPGLLLFPDYPQGQVEYRPGAMTSSFRALRWFSGVGPTPAEPFEDGEIMVVNDGQGLVRAAEQLNDLRRRKYRALTDEEGATEEMKAAFDEEIAAHERALQNEIGTTWANASAWWVAVDGEESEQ
jgi:transcriptional regulator with XRE-family HTH domain